MPLVVPEDPVGEDERQAGGRGDLAEQGFRFGVAARHVGRRTPHERRQHAGDMGIDAADGGLERIDETEREGGLRGAETADSASDPGAGVGERLAGGRKEARGIVPIGASERGNLRRPGAMKADAALAKRRREPRFIQKVASRCWACGVTAEELEGPDCACELAVAREQREQVALVDGVRRGWGSGSNRSAKVLIRFGVLASDGCKLRH